MYARVVVALLTMIFVRSSIDNVTYRPSPPSIEGAHGTTHVASAR